MSHEIAPRTGVAFTLDRGQRLTVIDPLGEQVADLLAFGRGDVGEVISSGRTLDYASRIFLTTGDKLYSNRSNVMLDIVSDNVGRHDFLLTPCSKDTFRIIYGDEAPHRGCFGNLAAALAPYDVTEDMIPTAFNVFMNVPVDGATGELRVEPNAVRLLNLPVGDMNTADRRQLGLRYVPEQRLGHGAVAGMTLADNALLTGTSPHSGAWLETARAREDAARIIQRFGVQAPTVEQNVETLSGGNLQKYIVGRETLQAPRVLLLDQPTWGVDAGSAAAIRNELIALRAAGCAIVIVSEELDELYQLADRLLVMANGRLSPSRPPQQIGTAELGRWMAGLWPSEQQQPASTEQAA